MFWKNIKKNIYISLKYYWAISDKFNIMAIFLDSWYKNLDFISNNNIKKKSILLYKYNIIN